MLSGWLNGSFRAGVTLALVLLAGPSGAQQIPNPGDPAKDTLPPEPLVFTSAGQKIRVVPTRGLSRPFALAFLPNGDMLVTERAGRLRLVRNGVLDPQPIAGIPPVLDLRLKGLQDVAVHPRFADNRFVYFTYYKPKAGETDVATATLARGRFDGGHALTDVRDIFVSDAWCASPSASRIAFARDGKNFMTIGVPIRGRAGTSQPEDSQNPANHVGKVLRLNDDGSVPEDNPFVGRPGYKPEIYALGIRNALGLTLHPDTGELWETENGPQGGDEVNIIRRGLNYGWPVVTYGRAYTSDPEGKKSGIAPPTVQPPTSGPGMEEPITFYKPSIAISGMLFYTGDKFPLWRGNLFVGGLAGMQLSRIVFNRLGLETRREPLLLELRQRIRDVRQGPDGLLYLTTDMPDGAILKIEPVAEPEGR